MDLSNLKPNKGSVKKPKRVGRGEGSGHGGTATRGHKGAQSRSGYKSKNGFEGGQMPLYRRLPKFGFKNPGRVAYKGINLDAIQNLAENKSITDFDINVFAENGMASKSDLIKILGRGELKIKVNVKANAFTKTALTSIEAQGGTATKI